MRNGYRQQQETFVREPDEFQPFDVRALAHLYNVRVDTSVEARASRKFGAVSTTEPNRSLTSCIPAAKLNWASI